MSTFKKNIDWQVAGLKHSSLVLPHENQSDFDDLFFSLLSNLVAEDSILFYLIEDLAILIWKKIRLEKLETAIITEQLNMPFTAEEVKENCKFEFIHGVHSILSKLHTLDSSKLETLKNRQSILKEILKNNINRDDCSRYLKKDLDLDKQILIQLSALDADFSEYAYSDDYQLLLSDIKDKNLYFVIKNILHSVDIEVSVIERFSEFKELIQVIRNQRLLKLIEYMGSLRIRNYLNESIHINLKQIYLYKKHKKLLHS